MSAATKDPQTSRFQLEVLIYKFQYTGIVGETVV